ncbi:MAG: transporter substrate-binding domain-containing protein [Proteobacteria bacterium]|nr:transporter substrate-binding domain-containing protein [Pseudomonadota bacterium]MBU1388329.1 transporter substrate-binding domain-containing protein [Pseudomonadota bacterium]MBU1542853.1 transporter substrate-binding domain-containing protein [Pseudomonadota bacterium]
MQKNYMVRIGVGSWPPVQIVNGKVTGLSIDYIERIFTRHNIRFEYIEISWSDSLEDIKNNSKIDLTPTIRATSERQKDMVFTQEYLSLPWAIFTRTDSPAIKGIDDLKGKTIVVEEGYVMHHLLEKDYPEINLHLLSGLNLLEKCMGALATGQADAYIGNLVVGSYAILHKGFGNLKVAAPTPYETKNHSMGIRRDWPELAGIINKTLAAMNPEEHTAIREKWFPVKFETGIQWSTGALQDMSSQPLTLTSVEKEWLQKHPVLRVATDPYRAPIEFRNPKGRFQGVAIDYLKTLEEMLSIRFEVVTDLDWKNLVAGVKKGDIDMFSCLARTPERDAYLSFTQPYIKFPVAIFARDEVPYISDLKKLAGRKVAVVEGYAVHEWMARDHQEIELIPVKTTRMGLEKLQRGEVLAFVENLVTTGYYIGQMNMQGIKVVGNTPYEYSQAMAVRNDNPILRDILQKALDAIPKARENEIYQSWLAVNVRYEHGFDYTLLWQVLAASSILIFAFFYWNRRLKKEVERQTEIIKSSEKQFRRTFEQAAVGIVHVSMDGRYLQANQRFIDLVGYSLEELKKLTFKAISHPDDLDADLINVKNLLSGDIQTVSTEKRYLRKDKSHVWVNVTVSLFRNSLNKPEYFIIVVEDIRNRKRMEIEKSKLEAQLRQSQKMEAIGTLAGGIAHDFNNILSPIIGYAEILKEDFPSGSPEYDSALEIFNAGRRGAELVKQILAFSRRDDHKLRPVRVQTILAEVLKLIRSSIPMDIEIHQEIQQDCGPVMAETTKLHQISMNLITNAYHAVEKTSGVISVLLKETFLDDGEIRNSPLPSGQYLMLSVSDNGTGISRKIRNQIFEPYFTTKEKNKGTGLGLAVVHGIVKEYKGDIRVYSEEGKGTTFNIYLPVIKKSTQLTSDIQELKLETGTERILLVDDEKSVVQLVTQMLNRLGYSVASHSSSNEALEAFKANPENYDLVITDMTMPNITGDRLAQKMISIRPNIPILLCTGFSERINKEQAETIGIKGFLLKPIVVSELAKEIRIILNRKNTV